MPFSHLLSRLWPTIPANTSANTLAANLLPAEAGHMLWRIRAALMLVEVGMLWLAEMLLGAQLPWPELITLLGLHAMLMLWAWHAGRTWQRTVQSAGLDQTDTFLQLATDAAILGGMVYFTGGYANPFISLLLVPLILAAVLLPTRHAWGLATWVGVLYTLLMTYYQPLQMQVSSDTATHLHLMGMWLNFLLTAALVAAFVGALSAALRHRDAALAEAREQRLRDEQLFALGLQAASAAHDLATPLASVRLTLDDLRADFSGDDELMPPLTLMTRQLTRVEEVLSRLSQAARSRECVAGPALPAATWLARSLERWGLWHPDAHVTLSTADDLPLLEDDPALEAVLMTLLNNAAEVSPQQIGLHAWAEPGRAHLEIRDAGAGLGNKPAGWGVGLELAQAALQRLGGSLVLTDTPEGGVLAHAEIPCQEQAR